MPPPGFAERTEARRGNPRCGLGGSFGTAVVIDSDSRQGLDAGLEVLRRAEYWDDAGAQVTISTLDDGTSRLSVYAPYVQAAPLVESGLVAAIGRGRVVIGDDFDEWGAHFASWRVEDGTPTLTYRYAIRVEDADPLPADQIGPQASAALADLWGVDLEPLLAIDADVERLADELGVVAGTRPWFDALGVRWPGG